MSAVPAARSASSPWHISAQTKNTATCTAMSPTMVLTGSNE